MQMQRPLAMQMQPLLKVTAECQRTIIIALPARLHDETVRADVNWREGTRYRRATDAMELDSLRCAGSFAGFSDYSAGGDLRNAIGDDCG